MNVLHLIKTSIGAQWALLQIKELVSLGIKVHVALPDCGKMVGRYEEVGAKEHIMQTDFPIREPWKFITLSNKFNDLINNIKPDIIHSHFVGTTLTMRLSLGRKSMIPRVFQVPGPLHLEHSLFRKGEIATASSVDHWIGSCKWTCECYRKSGIDESKIHLSYYGSDFDFLRNKERGSLRKELGINKDIKIIGMVAYMYAPKKYLGQKRGLKGHEDLIDAIAICLKKKKDIVCVIVGNAWDNIEYEVQVHKYAAEKCGNKVVFLGYRKDVFDIYPDFDVVVHPSHSENVGGALESLMNAIPTIATNVGGFPDLICPDKTGWLVPPKNPQKIAEAIIDILNNPQKAKALAIKGQFMTKKMLDVRRNAQEIADIYNKISICDK